MMKRGLETSDATAEGIVSPEIVRLRLAIDYPVLPTSLFDIVDTYFNVTNFLSDSSKNYAVIDMENVFDIYWPLPLLGFSGLPIWPVVSELMWRFRYGFFFRYGYTGLLVSNICMFTVRARNEATSSLSSGCCIP
jgi:hypothetical protein